jgi:hypothetical protein
MAWKPKTIAGKILKGAVIAGGSVLGLATGIGIIGKVSQAASVAKGVTSGTGILAKIATGAGAIKNKVDLLKESAANLITGVTQEQRDLIKDQKQESIAAQQKLTTVKKLMRNGATAADARASVGLAAEELTEVNGEVIQSAGMFDFLKNKNVQIGAAIIAGIVLLPKLLKKSR